MTPRQKSIIDSIIGEQLGFIRVLPGPKHGTTCSNTILTVRCDGCGKEYQLSYDTLRKRKEHGVGCIDCLRRAAPEMARAMQQEARRKKAEYAAKKAESLATVKSAGEHLRAQDGEAILPEFVRIALSVSGI